MAEKTVEWCVIGLESVCMPSAEWAAWAQLGAALLGAFATVFVAWWVGHSQRTQGAETLRMLQESLVSALAGLHAAAATKNNGQFDELRHTLSDVSLELRNFPQLALGTSAALKRLQLIQLATAALGVVQQAKNPQFLHQQLSDSADSIESLRVKVVAIF